MLCRYLKAGAELVSGVKEEDAVLSCLNSSVMDPKSSHRVRWLKSSADSSLEIIFFEWPKSSQKVDRVSLKDDGKGQKCLHLKSLQKSDEGLYRCEVWEGWNIIQVKNLSLKVKGEAVLINNEEIHYLNRR